MLGHCAHARYVWNLAVEQHSHWRRGKKSAPGFAERCRQLTEARRENEWLREGNADVMQQALKDFARAKSARFTSGFGGDGPLGGGAEAQPPLPAAVVSSPWRAS